MQKTQVCFSEAEATLEFSRSVFVYNNLSAVIKIAVLSLKFLNSVLGSVPGRSLPKGVEGQINTS